MPRTDRGKMDQPSVFTPQFAELDAQNDTSSTPSAASDTGADNVINTKTDSTQVQGAKSEEELLNGLLTDHYCHLCEAVLLFKAQRMSHYEGKKHAQKIKLYLQGKRSEKMNKECTEHQWTAPTDKNSYCELCNMVFKSPVVANAHYQGKVHSRNLRRQCLQTTDRYKESSLQGPSKDAANEGNKSAPVDGVGHSTTTTASTEVDLKDPNKYCALCAASFNNPQMALQHYNGRRHGRNEAKRELHKELGDNNNQGRHTEQSSLQSPSKEPANDGNKSASGEDVEPLLGPSTSTTSTDVDLKDPNKYCALCAASFNNPQMALQHYNGRKHQRNEARRELHKELGDCNNQDSPLMCKMCSMQFNSVEMYQAHMQGNKHQIREKKVIDVCKSQQKSYSTFTDELADYIQVQKARGLKPKTGQVPSADSQKEDEQDKPEEVKDFSKGHSTHLHKPEPNFPPMYNPPDHTQPGCYYTVKGRRPPYRGRPLLSQTWGYNRPPPALTTSETTQFTTRPVKRKRRRNRSSSSSYSTSSSSSCSLSNSYSSRTSDSDNSEYRRRDRSRKSRRERDRRARDVDSDTEGRKRKQCRRVKDKDSEDRGREKYGESEEERSSKKSNSHGKRKRRDKKSPEEDFEGQEGKRLTDHLQPEDTMETRNETEVHVQAEMNVEQQENQQDELAKPKYKREKKKAKEKIDPRTEEEKLWDDSILGC